MNILLYQWKPFNVRFMFSNILRSLSRSKKASANPSLWIFLGDFLLSLLQLPFLSPLLQLCIPIFISGFLRNHLYSQCHPHPHPGWSHLPSQPQPCWVFQPPPPIKSWKNFCECLLPDSIIYSLVTSLQGQAKSLLWSFQNCISVFSVTSTVVALGWAKASLR